MTQLFRATQLAIIALLLAACQGSGGDNGDDGDPADPGDPGDAPSQVATLNLVASSNTLRSDAESAEEGNELTAIARDDNNNVVEGEAITFAADSGALQVTRDTTDAAGTAAAILTTAGNPRNRGIEVTASAGNAQSSVTIEVTGTQLDITGPGAVPIDNNATYTISLRDAGGDGIANETVLVSTKNGNTLSQTNPDTNASGQAQVELTGDNPGQETITAEALGLTASIDLEVGGDNFRLTTPSSGAQIPLNTDQTVTLRWEKDGNPQTGESIQFSTTRGALSSSSTNTDGNGEATVTVRSDNAGPATLKASESGGLSTSTSVQFIATQSDSISVSADPATVDTEESSDIVAVVRDPNNNRVTGATVNFTVNDPSGGNVRDASVETDTQGRAQTVYTAGDTSASEPAEITATVSGTNITDTTEVTIAGQAVRIALGTGNELQESDDTTKYIKPYTAVVTDSAGNPVPDADFKLSIKPVSYQKGQRVLVDTDGDGTADGWATAPGYAVTPDGDPGEDDFGCFNEDLNANNFLDSGEDVNNNGSLDPTNPVTVPETVELDEDGTGQFDVTYPQNFAVWLVMRLRATASVEGTESVEDVFFVLPILADDVDDPNEDPPGRISPFGTASECTNPD